MFHYTHTYQAKSQLQTQVDETQVDKKNSFLKLTIKCSM